MAATDSVVAFLFIGVGLVLMLKMLQKPGLKTPKPQVQTMASTDFFSNPGWGNYPGTPDSRGWMR